MRKFVVVTLLSTVLIPFWAYSQSIKANYHPKRGFVPDEVTAIAIAEAVWKPIYGAKDVNRSKPISARLVGDIWRVEGTLPPGVMGGVPIAEISKTDGRVLGVIHSK